jgi:type I restriction enzyme, S subunit
MNKNKKNIPELRFPEFLKEREWEEVKFDKLCKFIRGPFGGALKKEIFVKEGYAVFEQSHAIYNDFNSFRYFITDEKFNELKRFSVQPFDIIMSCSGTMGKFAIVPEDTKKGIINQALLKLTVKEGYDVYFVKEILELPANQNKLLSQSAGGAIKNVVEVAQIKEINLSVPNLKEQQKIAACLSSLDNLIEAHTKKLDAIKEHKKGLMQNLFPQEGEKVPRFRFTEFKKDGAWEKETVGDLYDFKVTNSFAREYLNYEDGSVKNIHYGDIHTKFNTLFDITKENVPYINSNVSIEKIRKECYCIVGDIVFADASEDMNDVGKSMEIVNLNNEKLVSGLHTLLARQKENKLAIGFGGYLFKSNWVRKQIQREAQGAKVLGISATRISNIQILYPQNHKEQKVISLCLSSLDEIIKAQENKIEQLKKHKKGLMQGLFPKISE